MMQREAGNGRPPSFPWTDAKVAMLRELWATEESSATQIACALGFGTVGRNAVIGKIHRLGLGRRNRSEIRAALVKNAQATHEKRRAKFELRRVVIERKKAAKTAKGLAEVREKRAAAGRAFIAKVQLTLIDNPAFVAKVEKPFDPYSHLRSERGYHAAIAALSR